MRTVLGYWPPCHRDPASLDRDSLAIYVLCIATFGYSLMGLQQKIVAGLSGSTSRLGRFLYLGSILIDPCANLLACVDAVTESSWRAGAPTLNDLQLGTSSLRRGWASRKGGRSIHKIGNSHQIIACAGEDHWVPKKHHCGVLRPSKAPAPKSR